MSILVKGVEMPEDCRRCPFSKYYMNFGQTRCRVTGKILADFYKPIPFEGRAEECHLVDVPSPHGRLIDEQWIKDAMITTLEALKKNPKMDRQEMHLIAAFDTLRAMLEDAPTVVEKEDT